MIHKKSPFNHNMTFMAREKIETESNLPTLSDKNSEILKKIDSEA